jgi:hypothetical protein
MVHPKCGRYDEYRNVWLLFNKLRRPSAGHRRDEYGMVYADSAQGVKVV